MKQSAKEKNITKEAHIEAVWRSFGKTVLFAAISLQKKVTTAEGDLLIGHENFESLKKKKGHMVSGGCHRLGFGTKIHQAKSVRFVRLVCVSEEAQ